MMTFPTPPTVMPSVGEGTGASPVQVPCAYPDGAAAKVASAPAAMARSHFRRMQEWSNIFLPPLEVHERQSAAMRAFQGAADWGGGPWLRAVHTRAVRSRALGASVDRCGRARLRPVRVGRLSGGTNRASADVRPPL